MQGKVEKAPESLPDTRRAKNDSVVIREQTTMTPISYAKDLLRV